VVRLDEKAILAGSGGSPVLMRSENQGASWEPFQNNYGGDEGLSHVQNLKSITQYSDTLYTSAQGGVVARSVDGGHNWELMNGIWDNFGGLGTLLYVDPYYPGRIWSGGVHAIPQLYLIKSDDYGENWTEVSEAVQPQRGGAIPYVILTHPNDTGKILVGLSNAIKASNDSGETWQTVLKETGIRSLASGNQHPDLIYASGRDYISSQNISGKLFFV